MSELFAGFGLHRLLSVPAHDADHRADHPDRHAGDRLAAGLVAALTAAHVELSAEDQAGLVTAWQRPAATAPLEIVVGGRPYFPPAGPGPVGAVGPLLYPPGSIGVAVEPADVVKSWQAMPAWIECAGRADPLWADQPAHDQPVRGGFVECVAHLADPFVWLIQAEPAPAEAVTAELAELARRIPALRQRENSQLDRIALDRAQARYRELSRAQTVGTWWVRFAVGGPSPSAARRTASVLCAAADLGSLPYVLVPAAEVVSFEDLSLGNPPVHATTELLAALTAPPHRELPGIRVVEPARFDVTPEYEGDVPVGAVLDNTDQTVGAFTVRTDTLNRHTFVAGATGAGKSHTVRHLLAGLHDAGIPWLVIEPVKAEYAGLAARVGADQIAVIRPGAPDAVPLMLNPLEPEPGFPLSTHIDLVRALFLAAFQATEPFPQILAAALARCYRDLGWDTTLGTSRFARATPRYPTLADLQTTALDVVADIGYGKDVTDNVRGFIDVRIGSLRLGAPGRFFTGGHPLDMADLLRRNVILEIEDIGNDQDSAFVIGAILIRLHEHLRVHRDTRAGALRHVTVVEEAHRLLKRIDASSPAALAIELFTTLLAEIRAYGEGIVVAEQIPTKIVPDVIKNTALKIVHRLPAADDREAVGATMNLDEMQSRHVVSLPPGRAAVFTDGMDRPIRVEIPLGAERESADPPTGRVAIARCAGAACPTVCASHPCHLRQIVQAARVAEDPRLGLWLEMLTVAHVLGYPEPRPERSWLDQLASTDRRTLDCAVGQLAVDAVDRRYAALVEYYQPEDLARHVAARARAHLDGHDESCDGSEVGWQAGLFRWRDVFVAFTHGDFDPDVPHPLTGQWQARGLDLGTGPAREQLLNLQRLPSSRTTDRTAIDGTGHPPAHQRLAVQLSRPDKPMHRFIEATRFLIFTSVWPLHRLYPEEWAAWQPEGSDRE
jgi:hypothetical protein